MLKETGRAVIQSRHEKLCGAALPPMRLLPGRFRTTAGLTLTWREFGDPGALGEKGGFYSGCVLITVSIEFSKLLAGSPPCKNGLPSRFRGPGMKPRFQVGFIKLRVPPARGGDTSHLGTGDEATISSGFHQVEGAPGPWHLGTGDEATISSGFHQVEGAPGAGSPTNDLYSLGWRSLAFGDRG